MLRRIGVFDSGLGGLTVLDALLRTLPQLEYIYLGDTARTPYGSKSDSTITTYAREAQTFFLTHEIDLLVIACNTVSSVALKTMQDNAPFPVIGTIEPAIEACLPHANLSPIGVLGTAATIASNAYQMRLQQARPDVTIESVACPLFVPLVEDGITSGSIVDSAFDHYLTPLRKVNPGVVILGCTHYPLLREPLQRFFGPQVALVECSEAIATKIKEMGEFAQVRDAARPLVKYFVTDAVSRFNALARKFLKDQQVEAVQIEML